MSVNTKAIFETMSDAAMAGDEKTLKELSTSDCVVTNMNDNSTIPFVDNWMALHEKYGKIEWINTYTSVTDRAIIYRCYDYVETKDGKKSCMFFVDGVCKFNEDGKVCAFECSWEPEQAAALAQLDA